jgi:serine/threonine protein kinase
MSRYPDPPPHEGIEEPTSLDVLPLLDGFWEALRSGKTAGPEEWGGTRPDECPSPDDLRLLRELYEAVRAVREDSDLEAGLTVDYPPAQASFRRLLTPGTVLAQYRIDSWLDGGGMGEVYRATHRVMNNEVAIKVVAGHLADRESALARFRKEVQALARLRPHPNIAAAFDAGEHEGRLYLVMEYVPGTDLKKYVCEHGPLPVDRACDFIRQAALGLEYIHRHGIIHRDIKPSNLMLLPDHQVKILDLGLARLAGEPGHLSAQEEQGSVTGSTAVGAEASTHTPAGAVLGTYGYMPPEQAHSGEVDARSDLYSLGCTFYYLLTGRAPYANRSGLPEEVAAHQQEPVPALAELRPDVPRAVQRVVERLLAKRPEDRYLSAQELLTALERCAAEVRLAARLRSRNEWHVYDGRPASRSLPTPLRRVRKPIAAAVAITLVLFLVVGGGLVWLADHDGRSKSSSPGGEQSTAGLVAQSVTAAEHEGKAGEPQILALSAERRPISRYATIPKQPPSVLLQRQRDPDPWAKLRPEDPVYSGNYLLSLPGYRSRVYLDNGTHLTLWGNIPEFSSFPPVLESTVLLLVPPPGVDVDMVLDRGRVRIANYKPKGELHARVRFQQEVWDLTLPDKSSEVVVELWGLYTRDVPFTKEPGGKAPLLCLGLFTKGRAGLSRGGRKYQLADATQLTWTNRSPIVVGPEPLKQLPAWWSDHIERTPQAADRMIALTDLAELLSKHDDITATVVGRLQESQEPSERVLGVLFLAALDAIPQLIDALQERRHPEIRNAAVFALRRWMSRGHDYVLEVLRDFEKKAYSRQDAEIILRLFHSFSDEELANPKTFAFLIRCLGHERLIVRDLAFQHLALLVPEGAKKIQYDPNADPDKRKPAVEQWKQLIPEGKVPAKLAVGPPGKPKEGQ